MAHPHAHMSIPHCTPVVPCPICHSPTSLAPFATILHHLCLTLSLSSIIPPQSCFDICIWPHLTTIIFVLSHLVSSRPRGSPVSYCVFWGAPGHLPYFVVSGAFCES